MTLHDIKLLYIEDDDFIRQNAMEFLSYYCANLFEASDGVQGYEAYLAHQPDIIITDIKMPRLDGIALTQKIRQSDTSTQIIILTAHADTDFLLKAVELHLVKYLIKPVSESTLMPVLKNAVSLLEQKKDNIIHMSSDYRYDTQNKTLFQANRFIKLNQKELQFLDICAVNSERVVTYIEFNHAIWEGEMSDYALSSLVKSLRSKLPENTLQNVSGVGYRLVCA